MNSSLYKKLNFHETIPKFRLHCGGGDLGLEEALEPGEEPSVEKRGKINRGTIDLQIRSDTGSFFT